MPTVWRAADLAPTQREESFVDVACETIVPYARQARMVLEDRDEFRTADIGMLRVMRLSWTEGAAVRTPKHVRRSDPGMCKIDITLSGRFGLEQSDRRAALGAGTFTFVDLSRPHRVCADRSELAVVMFPRALLPLRDKDIGELAGTTFDRTQPGSALVTSVVRELTGNLAAYEGQGGARISESIMDLISATLAARVDRTQAVPSDSQRRVLVQRIRAFIEANLDDPELAPPVIAARHHISPRLLHKLFESEGSTVAGLIRARRLARCRHDLVDPAQANRPVASIAARWGIHDAAYFSRLFHAAYGMPPGEYRRLAANRPEPSDDSEAVAPLTA
jgi:AraC-like DNA-binding protein